MPSIVQGWIENHAGLIAGLSLLSVLLLGVTVIATPWLIGRLPQNYFSRPPTLPRQRGLLRTMALVVRNLAGVLFMLLGVLMLVAPGPGLVGILLGLSLCEFPGKRRLIQRFASHPPVYRSLNWLRQRQHKAPFDAP